MDVFCLIMHCSRENLSTHSKTRAKSLTVSSPFNFRSDERAEKRKEVELEKTPLFLSRIKVHK